MDAGPSASRRLSSVWHRPRGRARRPTEEESEVATLHVGKRRRLIRQQLEAEVRGVEGDGRLDVLDHVADMDGVAEHRPHVTEQWPADAWRAAVIQRFRASAQSSA